MNDADSLLGISVDQGLVGEHEASVGTQQEGVSHVGHRRRLGGPPEPVKARNKAAELPVRGLRHIDRDGHAEM